MIFAGCEIEAVAGRGGMGVVYRARQLRPERLVAIKVIADQYASDPEFRERFEREIALAPHIEHPNVIPVYQVDEEDGLLFIVMRFVKGGHDLHALCEANAPVAPADAARLVTQIALALDAAHACGVVHRDVKPANVLVTGQDGQEHLYLTDFGLARRIDDSTSTTRHWVGTLDYISPEQIRNDRVDARSDIYSLGCVLYRLLTSEVPFASLKMSDREAAHRAGTPPQPPSELVPGLPIAFDEVIARAMAAAPQWRFLSAGDLARASRAAASGQPDVGPDTIVAKGTASFDRAPVPPIATPPVLPASTRGPRRPPPEDDIWTRLRRMAPRRWLSGLALIGFCVLLALVVVPQLIGDRHVVSTDWIDARSSDTVRYCSGEDLSAEDKKRGLKGVHRRGVDDYVKRYPGAKAEFESGSTTANIQRKHYLQLIEEGSTECDVIFLDVIYMSEFVHKGLLYDMTPYLKDHSRQAEFNNQMIKTVTIDDKLWGAPKQLDAGTLYYRTDRVTKPSSWLQVYRQANPALNNGLPGLRLQRETDEGLTVVFLELAYAASNGRPIISEDGTTANLLDEPGVLRALQFMRNAIDDQVIPPTEPDNKGTLDVYERGRAAYLRGWPFVAARLDADCERGGPLRKERCDTARYTRIAPLPPWRSGGTSYGVLGGHNLVIPRSAPNPEGALHFIDFLTSQGQVRKDESLATQYPVLKSVAEDKSTLTNRDLARAIRKTQLLPRPSLPNYYEISDVIAAAVKRALDGPQDPDSVRSTLSQMDADVQRLLR